MSGIAEGTEEVCWKPSTGTSGEVLSRKGMRIQTSRKLQQITRSETRGFREFLSGRHVFSGLLEHWSEVLMRGSSSRDPLPHSGTTSSWHTVGPKDTPKPSAVKESPGRGGCPRFSAEIISKP